MQHQETRKWAANELKEIMMSVSKTRYKDLVGDSATLTSVENAFIAVAIKKAESYEKARAGMLATGFGWIKKDPQSASQVQILQQNMVPIADVPMFYLQKDEIVQQSTLF